MHSLSCICEVGHLVIEGDQAGQRGPTFPKHMLAGPDTLAVLYMLCDPSQDHLLCLQHILYWTSCYQKCKRKYSLFVKLLQLSEFEIKRPQEASQVLNSK